VHGRNFDFIEVAREVGEKGHPEFLRTAGGEKVPISAGRIRDYVSHLHELGIILQVDRRYRLNEDFAKPSIDAEWAQYLADMAQSHLGKLLDEEPAAVPAILEKQRKKLHAADRVPTVAAIMSGIGIDGSRTQEKFKWSLFLYMDGGLSPLEIHRYPHLVPSLKQNLKRR
jgi:hypothetical protein